MKKIKILPGALGILLVLSGCSNFNNDVSVEKYDVKEALSQNSENGNSSQTPFKITNITLNSNKVYDDNAYVYDSTLDEETEILVEFNMNLDESSLSGLSVKALVDDKTAETTDEEYTKGSAVPFTAELYDSSLYLTLSLKGIDKIQLYADSSAVKAENGQKLDMDGDFVQGEALEDDAAKTFSADVPSSSWTYGCEEVLPSENEIGFSTSSDTYGFYSLGFAENSSGNITNFQLSLDQTVDEDLSDVLKKTVKIQKYDSSSKKWTDLSDVSVSRTTSALSVYRYYIYAFTFTSQAEGTVLRAYIPDQKAVKTSAKYNGHERYLTVKDNAGAVDLAKTLCYSSAVSSSYYDTYAFDQDFLTVSAETDGSYITALNFEINTSNASISALDDGSGYVCGIKNLEENLAFTDYYGNEIDIGNYTVVESTPVKCTVSGETFNSKVQYFLETPIENTALFVFAKPDMEIVFNKTDSAKTTDSGEQVSYKLGKARTESSLLAYGGNIQLGSVSAYDKTVEFTIDSSTVNYKTFSNNSYGYNTMAVKAFTIIVLPGESIKVTRLNTISFYPVLNIASEDTYTIYSSSYNNWSYANSTTVPQVCEIYIAGKRYYNANNYYNSYNNYNLRLYKM